MLIQIGQNSRATPNAPKPHHPNQSIRFSNLRRRRDSNPRYPCEYAGFQNRCLKPLGHSSGRQAEPTPPGAKASGNFALSALIVAGTSAAPDTAGRLRYPPTRADRSGDLSPTRSGARTAHWRHSGRAHGARSRQAGSALALSLHSPICGAVWHHTPPVAHARAHRARQGSARGGSFGHRGLLRNWILESRQFLGVVRARGGRTAVALSSQRAGSGEPHALDHSGLLRAIEPAAVAQFSRSNARVSLA